jgi:DNA polymerase-3 subunit beta
MKFSCSQAVLLKEITSAQKVISQKNSISIVSNVVLSLNESDFLIIKATDAKVWFETQIAVTKDESGEIAVFCDKFLNVLRVFPDGDLFISTNNDVLTITSEKNKALKTSLRFQTTESFPQNIQASNDKFFRLTQREFLRMRHHTIFSVSTEETRIFVNGVYMEKKEDKLIMVSTDAKRLSYIAIVPENPLPDFTPVIMPPKFLNLIKDLAYGEGEMSLAIVDRTIYAQFDNIKISSILIEGQFPNYNKVIPENFNYQMSINRFSFNDALRRAAVMSDLKNQNRIYLTFNDKNILFKALESKTGEIQDEIEALYLKLNASAEDLGSVPMTMALNHIFLSEPLKAMDSENFRFSFTSENSPVVIAPLSDEGEGDYFHVIMPMQLD